MRNDRCETCRYGENSANDDFKVISTECRWGPPQVVFNVALGAYSLVWPTMQPEEWCHQWHRKFAQEGEV